MGLDNKFRRSRDYDYETLLRDLREFVKEVVLRDGSQSVTGPLKIISLELGPNLVSAITDLLLKANANIAAESSLHSYIDSLNTSTGAVFTWNKDSGAQDGNEVRLMMLQESGQLTLYLGDFDLSGNDILNVGGQASLAASIADSGWIDLPFQNGWEQYSTGYNQCGYRKIGSIVYLRGLTRNGTDTTIATLPANFRPPKRVMHTAYASGFPGARVDITNLGEIIQMNGLNAGYQSLEGIYFHVD